MTTTFKTQFLKDTLNLPWSAKVDNITDHRRWSVVHQIVFEHEGKFYQTEYSVGATEKQDEGPWEYDDEVECEELSGCYFNASLQASYAPLQYQKELWDVQKALQQKEKEIADLRAELKNLKKEHYDLLDKYDKLLRDWEWAT